MPAERIVAIDPALRNTGYAVLIRDGKKVTCAVHGVIRNAAKLAPSSCLLAIREQVSDLIKTHTPTAMAVEGIIFVQSYQTAITLGAARAAAILAAAERGLPVHEYAPRKVKQAVVGRKPQPRDVVRPSPTLDSGLRRNGEPKLMLSGA